MQIAQENVIPRLYTCPTLEVYLLVSQHEPRIEVYRLANDWQQEVFTAGQVVYLETLNLKLDVDGIYESVFQEPV